MKLASIEAIVQALDEAEVRYLVVGGMAVVAHGYVRLTMDMDLVIQLVPDNVRRAFDALAPLGYRPRQPVTGDQFADAALRQSWIESKNMKVLNLYSDQHPETTIDVFVAEPFDFDTEYERAELQALAPGLPVRIVCIEALIAMKESVGRPRDVDDVWHLRVLKQEKDDATGD